MALKLTPQQLKEMMKNNPSLSINNSFGDNIDSLSEITKISKDQSKKQDSPIVKTLTKVHLAVANSTIHYEINHDSRSILMVFEGAKILSRNQTDSLKETKYTIMLLNKYKKEWLQKVEEILFKMKKENPTLMEFENEPLRLYLYRETDGRLYDEDNLVTGFKYIIDGLRQEILFNNEVFTLIKDDNQNYIKECTAYQVKSKSNRIAVRILLGSNKPNVNSFEDFKELD